LGIFKKLYPEAFQSCLSLYNKVKEIGFNSPASCFKSAMIVKSHIIKYGKRRAVCMFNNTWEALEIVTHSVTG